MNKTNYALVLSVLALTACGGGGGGGGVAAPTLVKTTITGTVAPPAAPVSGAVAATATVMTPPNSTGTWPSIVQSTDYVFDLAAAQAATPASKVNSMNVRPVDTQTASTSITTGAAYPTDPALGQMVTITNTLAGTAYTVTPPLGGTYFPSGVAPGLASVSTGFVGTPAALIMAEYALPYSATLSPAGYTYQTFGYWGTSSTNATSISGTEYYFSTGAPTDPATLPATGTASYTGIATGSYVEAATRDPAYFSATLNATADFAALNVAFSTTGSTSLSANAPVGTLPSANPGLNLNGTLNFAAGNNTFTGTVTSANGMAGNATGRFYGPGIAAATPSKVVGAPPEIGGTFAVMGTGGAMQGVFAGN